MQVEVDVKCMQTNFGGHGISGFGDFAPFSFASKRPNFPFRPWTIVHGGQKIESAILFWLATIFTMVHALNIVLFHVLYVDRESNHYV